MALPKIDVPTQVVILPSNKKEIVVRPFLVKEEKILLTAIESGDPKDIVHATKQVIKNCIVNEDVNIDKLPMYDLEYLILQLRIMSVGNTMTIKILGKEHTACECCKKEKTLEVDLATATVVFDENHKNKIQLTNKIGVTLRDPDAKLMEHLEKNSRSDDITNLFKLIWMCVENVYDEDTITSSKDVSEKEGIEFLESLSAQQFNKLDEFFKTIPKLTLPITVKCEECNSEETQILERLQNFFG